MRVFPGSLRNSHGGWLNKGGNELRVRVGSPNRASCKYAEFRYNNNYYNNNYNNNNSNNNNNYYYYYYSTSYYSTTNLPLIYY